MELVQLGDSGLRVSRVGLGCNNFGGRIGLEETRAVVDAALEVGVTFFDTAETYGSGGGSERLLGEILEARRDRVVLATKFGWGQEFGDGTAASVRKAIDGSLERLRTDYVDLYYLHKPDPATPIAETLGALDELVREGKVRAIGCSNFSAEQLAEADRVARELGTARFTVLQNHYNLLRHDDDGGRAAALPRARRLVHPVLPACERPLDREVPAGRACSRGNVDSRVATSRRSASTASRRTPPLRRHTVTRSTSSRSLRSRRLPGWDRSSPAPRRGRSKYGRTPPWRHGAW